MAHLVILASIPSDRIPQIAGPHDLARFASRIATCSHFVVSICPEAASSLDGGEPLATKMWHPIRGPVVFAPGAVPMALAKIEHIISHPGMVSGEIAVWLREELSKAAVLFHHAREQGESVVSMLDLTRPGPRLPVQPMDTKPARHPNLSFLVAFAIVPAALLIEQNVKPGAARVFGAILFLAAVGLVIVPPLRRQVPWPLRILSTLFHLLCWCLLTAMAAYVFGISPL